MNVAHSAVKVAACRQLKGAGDGQFQFSSLFMKNIGDCRLIGDAFGIFFNLHFRHNSFSNTLTALSSGRHEKLYTFALSAIRHTASAAAAAAFISH